MEDEEKTANKNLKIIIRRRRRLSRANRPKWQIYNVRTTRCYQSIFCDLDMLILLKRASVSVDSFVHL